MSHHRREALTPIHPSLQLTSQLDVVLARATTLLQEFRILQKLVPNRDVHWHDLEMDLASIRHQFVTMQHAMLLAMVEVVRCAPTSHTALLDLDEPFSETANISARPLTLTPLNGRGPMSAPPRSQSSRQG